MVCVGMASAAEFVVKPGQTVGPAFVGFGAEMNPYLYASPNWDDSKFGGVTEQNVKDLEKKVIELRPRFVRVFMVPDWREGKPDGINKQGEPRMWPSFLRTLRLAEKAGATITLTTWYGHPSEPERTARETVDVLVDLIEKEKISAIKSINMMNEPDMDWPGEENWTIEQYNRLYRTLDAELKRVGLRKQLQIISGDMVEDYQPKWMTNIAENLAELSDGISIHAYWRYDRTPFMLQRLDETIHMASTQPSIRDKPKYVTEFGSQGINDHVSGNEPWRDKSGVPMCDTTIAAMQVGWMNIEAVRRGFAGTVQWDMYDVGYDRLMHYGVIGEAKEGWPLKPGYFSLKMFTHTCEPGWRAVAVSGNEADLAAAAMRGNKGEVTVWVVNHGEGMKECQISGLGDVRDVKVITWNGDGNGRLSQDGARVDNGRLKLVVPASGIVAATNYGHD